MKQKTSISLPRLPVIPNYRVDIREYGAEPLSHRRNAAERTTQEGGKTAGRGATGTRTTSNTAAIASAIEAASRAGGGRVIVPSGVWCTGGIRLESRIELYLEEDAELRFSRDPDDYLPVVLMQRGGAWCYNYRPFIYARDVEDISIRGPGQLNGQGESWWEWKKAQPGMADLFRASTEGRPIEERVYGTLNAGVRPPFFQTIGCRRVLIDGVRVRNSPSWTIHPVNCDDVTVRNISLENPADSPNTDGINPDACRNVLVEHCTVHTGDDGICLKSGRERDGWIWSRPCENVCIRRCTVRAAHGGFVIGSDMSGGVRNVLVCNCMYDGTDRGIRLKPRPGRGGYIRDIEIREIEMRQIRGEAVILTQYSPFYAGSYEREHLHDVPEVSRVHIEGLRCSSAAKAVVIHGLPGYPFRDISLQDVNICAGEGISVEQVEQLRLEQVSVGNC